MLINYLSFLFYKMKKALVLLFLSVSALAQEKLDYPTAYKDTARDNYFGTMIEDPYRWLENDSLNGTEQWKEDEARFSEKYLTKIKRRYNPEPQLRLNSYFVFGTIHKSGKYYFDFIRDNAGDQPSLYIKKEIDLSGDKVVDPYDFRNNNHDKAKVTSFSVSEDNKYLAFEIAHNGSDWQEIYVKTLYPSHRCDDKITGVKFCNIEWSGNGFFYQRYPLEGNILKDEMKIPSIWYHKIGDDQNKDVFVYGGSDNPNVFIGFEKIKKGNYLIIYQSSKDANNRSRNKVLTVDLNNRSVPFKIDTLISSHKGGSYHVLGVYKDKFLVRTTLDAPHGKLLLFSKTEKNTATEFIPEHTEIIYSASIVGNKVLCTYIKDVDFFNITFDTSGDIVNTITFPVGCSVNGFEDDDNDSVTIFYVYSFLYPTVSYQYNVNSFTRNLVEQTKVTYNYTDFDIKKVYYFSKDGTRIPMLIAGKKNVKQTGDNPTILYGYGGYGAVTTPFYDRGFISFMENGGLIALPCIRGGGEYGDDWHSNGSLLNKQNVFDDFISAAEYLFAQKYTSSEHLALMGGSNGGLLVAAVINQRPDICKAVIAKKGVYDMLRYQNYTIGKAWINEYGTSADSIGFSNLIKYSPLHNIKEVNYPAVLIITADHDDRVVPLHSYKYTAALQAKNKSDSPVLLYVEHNMGHMDNDLLSDIYIYSFIYDQLDVPLRNFHGRNY